MCDSSDPVGRTRMILSGLPAIERSKGLLLFFLSMSLLANAAEGAGCFYLPEYFPLTSGNAWTFRDTSLNTVGTITVLPGTTMLEPGPTVATKALYASPEKFVT